MTASRDGPSLTIPALLATAASRFAQRPAVEDGHTRFTYAELFEAARTFGAALVCHGALSRFPALKVAVIENGSTWVEPLLKNLASVYKKMPQDFLENPIDVIERNVYISPFWEEDLGALAELIGVDHVLFGSDFPHPEGLADPISYLDDLAGLPDESVRQIMGGNLAGLIGVGVPV